MRKSGNRFFAINRATTKEYERDVIQINRILLYSAFERG